MRRRSAAWRPRRRATTPTATKTAVRDQRQQRWRRHQRPAVLHPKAPQPFSLVDGHRHRGHAERRPLVAARDHVDRSAVGACELAALQRPIERRAAGLTEKDADLGGEVRGAHAPRRWRTRWLARDAVGRRSTRTASSRRAGRSRHLDAPPRPRGRPPPGGAGRGRDLNAPPRPRRPPPPSCHRRPAANAGRPSCASRPRSRSRRRLRRAPRRAS